MLVFEPAHFCGKMICQITGIARAEKGEERKEKKKINSVRDCACSNEAGGGELVQGVLQ